MIHKKILTESPLDVGSRRLSFWGLTARAGINVKTEGWIRRAAICHGLLFFALAGLGAMPLFAASPLYMPLPTSVTAYDLPRNIDPMVYEGHPAAVESVAPKLPLGTAPAITLIPPAGTGQIKLNPELFTDLRLLVYGGPEAIQRNDFKAVDGGYYRHGGIPGEYRYHGYSAEGNLFTNQHFPNDSDSRSALSQRTYVHLPWQSLVGVYVSPLNTAALSGDAQAKAWFDRALPFPLLNSTKPEASRREGSYLLEEHLAILSMPSAGMPGEGRLWHWVDGRRWYQTVSLPDLMPARLQSPLSLKVEILDKNSLRFGPAETLPVRVRMTATLADGAVFPNLGQRALYLTRNEIQAWQLGEGGAAPKGRMAPVTFGTYTTLDAGGNATLIHETVLQVRKSEVDLQGVFTFTAQTRINFLSGVVSPVVTASDSCLLGVEAISSDPLSAGFSVADLHAPSRQSLAQTPARYANQSRGPVAHYQFKLFEAVSGRTEVFSLSAGQMNDQAVSERISAFAVQVMPGDAAHRRVTLRQTVLDAEGRRHEIEKTFNVIIGGEAKAVELRLSLPAWSFDMLPYPARDDSDHSATVSLKVAVEGMPISPQHFFSGHFKFSEVTGLLGRSNRHVKVVVEAISAEGVLSFSEFWIEVVSTQPKAQLSFSGTQKVNRKLAVLNDSVGAEDPRLAAAYPATYTFSYKAISGSDTARRLLDISSTEKHLLYKNAGRHQVTLTAVNSLGRAADPGVLDLVIVEDQKPAVIFNFEKGTALRGETVRTRLDMASTDGDHLGSAVIKVYFDAAVDGTYERFIGEYTPETFETFVPDELGAYRATLEVAESFGQPTLEGFSLPGDVRRTSVQRELLCENLRPVQTLDLEAPRNPDKVDVLWLLSSKLPEALRSQMAKGRLKQANTLRLSGMDALVHVWDLGEITERVPAATTQLFGIQYPPLTLDYAEGGYSGTLQRVSVQDNGRHVDYGSYQTVQSCSTEQVLVGRYCPAADPFICYVNGGYVDVYETREVCTTSQVWVSNYQWRPSYYGTYEGEVSRTLEQHFEPEWLRFGAARYIVYAALPEETLPEQEVQGLVETAGARWLMSGGNPQLSNHLKAAETFEGDPLASVSPILDWIASRHEVKPYKLFLQHETISYPTVDIETEGDGLADETWALTQYSDFDYPLAPETYYVINPEGQSELMTAHGPEAPQTFHSMTPPAAYSSVGHFTLSRKLRDVTPKPAFDLESNRSQVNFTVHRKPVAALELRARYEPAISQYRLFWKDLSYDPDHALSHPTRGITRMDVQLRPQNGPWQYGLPIALPGGTYEATVVVWDLEGQISDPVDYLFTIDNSVPEIEFVSVIPDPALSGSQPIVTLHPTDHDGGLLSLEFTATHSATGHTFRQSFSGLQAGKTLQFQMAEPLRRGQYSLKAEVTDDLGQSDAAVRPLTVRPPQVQGVTLTGAWNHWRGQVDRQGRSLPLNPHRFLAYEEIQVVLAAEGEPLSVTCRLSPALEAMTYVDPNGKLYRYREAFGEEVSFPLSLISGNHGIWHMRYKLPLAASTLSWTDHRLRDPYWLELTVTWEDHVERYRFDDLELTGNVYDLIF